MGKHLDQLDPITRECFRIWIKQNMAVWHAFKAKAMQMKMTGRKKYSAKTIVEIIRWDFDLNNPGDEFKINNDFAAYLARALVDKFPEFEGFFEFRTIEGLRRAKKEAA